MFEPQAQFGAPQTAASLGMNTIRRLPFMTRASCAALLAHIWFPLEVKHHMLVIVRHEHLSRS